MSIELDFSETEYHACRAKVVRLNLENKGEKGLALSFINMGSDFKKSLKDFYFKTGAAIAHENEMLCKNIETFT